MNTVYKGDKDNDNNNNNNNNNDNNNNNNHCVTLAKLWVVNDSISTTESL